jgi:hypothetical protein
VSEVEELQHAVHHRVAERDERVNAAGGEAVHQLLDEEAHLFVVGRRAPCGARRHDYFTSADHEFGICL